MRVDEARRVNATASIQDPSHMEGVLELDPLPDEAPDDGGENERIDGALEHEGRKQNGRQTPR